MRDFLVKLRESQEFREVMLDALNKRPLVPAWRPAGGQEAEKLIEEIKFKAGAQSGFDALYSHLTGKNSSNGQ